MWHPVATAILHCVQLHQSGVTVSQPGWCRHTVIAYPRYIILLYTLIYQYYCDLPILLRYLEIIWIFWCYRDMSILWWLIGLGFIHHFSRLNSWALCCPKWALLSEPCCSLRSKFRELHVHVPFFSFIKRLSHRIFTLNVLKCWNNTVIIFLTCPCLHLVTGVQGTAHLIFRSQCVGNKESCHTSTLLFPAVGGAEISGNSVRSVAKQSCHATCCFFFQLTEQRKKLCSDSFSCNFTKKWQIHWATGMWSCCLVVAIGENQRVKIVW